MKTGPLSDTVTFGAQIQEKSSFRIIFATIVGKASTHPQKVCMNTNKYLYPFFPHLTSVKLTFQ